MIDYRHFFKDIFLAKQASQPWNSSCVGAFKQELKKHLIENQKNRCCYCLKSLQHESERSKHIEHILPKSIFPSYMFDYYNLAISCVRCNSDIKGTNTDFLSDQLDNYRNNTNWSYKVYSRDIYRIIHPHLDKINNHLTMKIVTKDNRTYHFYKLKTEKSRYHYDYFKLSFYEIESISEAQGIHLESDSPSSHIIHKLFNRSYT